VHATLDYVVATHAALLAAHGVVALATLLVLPCVVSQAPLLARPALLPVVALLAGAVLAALLAANAFVFAAAPPVDARLVGCVAAAYAAAHSAHVWQLACLDVHASAVSRLALTGVFTSVGARAERRSRVAYLLARPLAALGVAAALLLLQGALIRGAAALGAPAAAWLALGAAAWLALGAAHVAVLCTAARRLGAVMTSARRELARVWLAWCVALPATGLAHALGAPRAAVLLPLAAGLLAALLLSTASAVFAAAVRGAVRSTPCLRARARIRRRRRRRTRVLRAAAAATGERDETSDYDSAADESDTEAYVVPPSAAVAFSHLRAIYRDDDLVSVWLRYVRLHHPSHVPYSVGLHCIGRVDAGTARIDQALHVLQSSSAVSAAHAAALWAAHREFMRHVPESGANGDGTGTGLRDAFTNAPCGRTVVLDLCGRLEGVVHAFVARSEALRSLAVADYFSRRMPAAAAAAGDGGGACPTALDEYITLLATGGAAGAQQ
jgi:hypothetical protein